MVFPLCEVRRDISEDLGDAYNNDDAATGWLCCVD